MATISERLQYILNFDTRQAIQAVDQFGKKADQAFDKDAKLDKLGSNMVKFGAAAVAAAGVAGAGLWKLGQGASDLKESINAVEVSYGDAGSAVVKMGEDAAHSLGLSRREFNEMATMFGGFAQKLATDGKTSADVLAEMTTRAADFASVFNIDVARAGALFQSGLAGETEALRRFGIDLSSASVEAYALANGITENAKQMTEAEKVTARYGLLLQSTEAYAGDFANTSDSLANRQKILAADIQNLKDGIGMGLLPMFESLIGAGSKVVGVFAGMSAANQKMIGTFAATGTAALGVLGATSMVIGQVIKMRDRFAEFPRFSKGFAVAMGVAAAAMIYFSIQAQQSAKHAQQLVDAVAALEAAEADKIAADFGLMLTAFSELNDQSPEETFAKIAKESLAAAMNVRDEARANDELRAELEARGLTLSEMSTIIREQTESQARANIAVEEATAAEQAATDAIRGTTQATEEQLVAQQRAIDSGYSIIGGANAQVDAYTDLTESTEDNTEATQEAAEAWGEWADELLAATEAAEDDYQRMVDAANEWADNIRDSVNRGAESFFDWEVTSETTAQSFLEDMRIRNAMAEEHEGKMAAVARGVQSGMVETGRITQDQADAFIAEFAGMGAAGGTLVDDLSKNPELVDDIVMEFVRSSENSSDGMLGAYDPVKDGIDDRMYRAQLQLGIRLANIKYDASVKSKEIGSAMPAGIIEKIDAAMPSLFSAGQRMVDEVYQGALSKGQIESPSKLFAEEVGEPIAEGVAVGIVEKSDEISEALGKAIDDAAEAAVDAAQDLVDEVSAVFDGLWDSIDDDRSLEDMEQSVAEAQANLAKVMGDSESSAEDVQRAQERLEDASYRLLKATQDNIAGTDEQRLAWIDLGLQAGLTVAEIDKLVDAYLRLARARAEAAAHEAAINAQAAEAQRIRTDFGKFVSEGLITGAQLESVGNLASTPGAQVNLMNQIMHAIVALFPKRHSGGVVPGMPGSDVPIMAQAGERVTSRSETMGSAMTPEEMRRAISDGFVDGARRVQQMERAR